jgi:hypothetical protein
MAGTSSNSSSAFVALLVGAGLGYWLAPSATTAADLARIQLDRAIACEERETRALTELAAIAHVDRLDPLRILTAFPDVQREDDPAPDRTMWSASDDCSILLIGNPVSQIGVIVPRQGMTSADGLACLNGLLETYTPAYAGRAGELLGEVARASAAVSHVADGVTIEISYAPGRAFWVALVSTR